MNGNGLPVSAYGQVIPISNLPPLGAPLAGTEPFPLVQNGVTCKGTIGNLIQYLAPLLNLTQNSKIITLFYEATAGQTRFPCGVADMFGNTFRVTAATLIDVYSNGSLLAPENGLGFGSYSVDYVGNAINLLNPAGAGQVIAVEVQGVQPLLPISTQSSISTEALAIQTTNQLPGLTYAPDGLFFIIFVNGRACFSTGPTPAFSWTNIQVNWNTSGIFAVNPGDEVIAVYSHP